MRKLLDAFLDLPSWQGAILIVALVAIVAVACLAVARIAYRSGRRAERARMFHFTTKRRELASIQL